MSNKNKKKKLWVNFLVVLIVIIVIGIIMSILFNEDNMKTSDDVSNSIDNSKEMYVEEIENGVKINTSTKFNEAKQVDGLTITNIQLTTKNGMSTFLADVFNNTDKSTELKMVEVTLLDYNGEKIITLNGIIDALEPGGTTQLNIAMTSDYINAYDFNVNIK